MASLDVFAELRRLGALIRQLQGVLAFLAGKQINVGTGSATWSASTNSGSVTVPHGLGRTPTVAAAFARNGAIEYAVTARDATNLTVIGFLTAGGTTTATLTFDWIAIG